MPTDPIALLARPLENLEKLAEQALILCTDQLLLEKGLTLMPNTRDFKYALTQWENKPSANKA